MEEGGGSGDEEGPMKKDLGLIGILAAGFNVSNSWLVIAATLVISIEYGPMNTVWGVICVTPIYLCIGLTLAELISVYPTAGGQYHWTSILAPSRIKNILSIAVVYTVVTLALLPIGSIACVQVASMMTWSLGRDGGLPFGSFLSRINQTLNAPVWALIWNYVVMFLIGILYLISSLAYNSIIGVSVILQQVVLVIPVSLVLYHRRSEAILPKDRAFYLPDWLGWTVNIVTFIFTVVIPVFLLFPTVNPPDQATMNYAVAVFGGVVLMSLANWVVYAMRHYNGPSTIKFHN
ncbi:hypothetical protein SCUCBS95973_003022 [Sporothrix curviconia]|uniref:Choline transport protein n=1 Tax=Sporothrix curviconia TaxID=1260050 RepID=A0ABP0BBS4_9PEZI